MKPLPMFDKEKATKNTINFIKRQKRESGLDCPDLTEKDLLYLETLLKYQELNWRNEFIRIQFDKGKQLIEIFISTLSKDNKELVEDYLDNVYSEANADGYESGYESAKNT